MNLETFSSLFSGSPFKPLSNHRDVIFEALKDLSQQLNAIYILQQPCQGRPEWLIALPQNLEQIEQDVLLSLRKPSLTALPKEIINTVLQTQCNVAHLICRLSERLSYRPVEITDKQRQTMHSLCNNFSKVIYQLLDGSVKLEALSSGGFRKQHLQLLKTVRQQLDYYVDELRKDSSDLRTQVYHQESLMNPLDIALLFMTLDDIGDLTFWMRSMVVQL